MKRTLAPCLLWAVCLFASPCPAAQLNLATLACDKYENEIVGTPGTPDDARSAPGAPSIPTSAPRPDAINTVMWLFGFAVASAGDHVMYGDALASFGFALDAQCRSHPTSSLLQAVTSTAPKRDQPMDLAALNCGDFESRHAESARSDPESANTIMMWLFGFSVGLSGGHVLDPDGVKPFAAALQERCMRNPNESLYESLVAVARPAKR